MTIQKMLGFVEKKEMNGLPMQYLTEGEKNE